MKSPDFALMMQLMQQMGRMAPKFAEKLQHQQSRLTGVIVTGESGAGMVRTKFNGHGKMISIEIPSEISDKQAREQYASIQTATC